MSFVNFPTPTPLFPVLNPLAWSMIKTPSFKSSTAKSITGRETMLIRSVFPRWEFTLTYGGDSWLRDQTQNIAAYVPLAGDVELQLISGLFLYCLGSYGEFYYEDPDDNSRTGAPLGIGTGADTIFFVNVPWGNGPFVNKYFFPVGGVNTVDHLYFNGVPQSSSIWSFNATKTSIIFNTPPPNGTIITMDFHFYYRCRWLDDLQSYSQWAKNLWEYKQVKFKSVKD